MTYRGHVQNGVVVLDGPAPADGTLVRVETVESVPAPKGSPQAVLAVAGSWSGDPSEVDRLLRELHEMKQAELAARAGAPDADE